MTATWQPQETLEALELRLRTILPEEYQDCYDDVHPVSMGSASLKYTENGKVAWNKIWNTFCDLAMAGGPPHKGTFLEPGTAAEIAANPERHKEVVQEICRGIYLATGLAAEPSPAAGWVRVDCGDYGTAAWLARAIVMENISARCDQSALELPAGPQYRVSKEIKNVVTAIAKTSHYWLGHMWPEQQSEIAALFARMDSASPLVQPALPGNVFDSESHQSFRQQLADSIHQATGLNTSTHRYPDWLGLECKNVRAAIWMMRALVVSNVFARREGTVLFVPLNPQRELDSVTRPLARIYAFASTRGVL